MKQEKIKMKSLKLSLHFGNKGFIFSMDATIALVILVLLLTIANIYLIIGNRATSSDIQTLKYGDDVIKILDEKGVLSSYDAAYIHNNLSSLLPSNYNMTVLVNCSMFTTSGGPGNIQQSSFVNMTGYPNNLTVFSGTRIFVTTNKDLTKEKYCFSRYWIWLK